ncbi:hypothetical protein CROQUDRAFT_673458 [Cronartium quercuum f. sp. fusiforme G11]|uniref:FAD-binding PCMH-type domain-containing protein n=1 Tax=Cronartium quercuum f. sp. fusiforme G11 TaxID=708437 RepID=A0A9P6NAE1_9BASI|nr:hypothetical protein CROQUDRAFT_673458 [Cronartium quercuum f. sp. fusiforme G11]
MPPWLGPTAHTLLGTRVGRGTAPTTEEVSKVVAYCVQPRLAIRPQGGDTGFVGGSVPVFDRVILNSGGLSHIRFFDETSADHLGILTADAGCILQILDESLNPMATNAGGLRLLRYGSLHGSVLGLEVVFRDEKGTLLRSGMKGGLRKDNTGYDLKQLFIGSEGTLGIITVACILTPERSTFNNVALLSISYYETIAQVFAQSRTRLGEIISAFEFFDQDCFDLVTTHTNQKEPFEVPEGSKQFYVLIETGGSNKDHDDEIPEAAGKFGKAYKYDISFSVSVMYDVVKAVLGYGHIGDGNLHINIVSRQWDSEVERAIEPWIYEWVSSKHDSISAEHGLGLMKVLYIGYSKDGTNVEMMRRIKQVFDPHQILDPGKYFLRFDHLTNGPKTRTC